MSSTPAQRELRRVLATDCGSTTTKAILFERNESGWTTRARGEAPTTVENPVADVTIGARNAFEELQEISGIQILSENSDESTNPLLIRSSVDAKDGIDLYVSTSSAGGGLQMIVLGVVATMSTESAERAALGAGAIVMDAIACDDGREQHEHVQRIRHLRPDISLIAGGTDGGTLSHPLQLAETLLLADPRPRFGSTLKLPVIYAANRDGAEQARDILQNRFAFQAVANLRPSLEIENLEPASNAIHEIFLNHVMSHAPGYAKLLSWTPIPILPTPAAVGHMVLMAARKLDQAILAVDIGGATTDVFSALREPEKRAEFVFHRTVSANLGMSYSVANVLLEAGANNILRWVPYELDAATLSDRLRNKMIRPTTIPQTESDLILEQAVCREALRLAFEHHKRLATGLKGLKKSRSIGDFFKQSGGGDSLVEMKELQLIIGSGGVLSHAPDRRSAAFMMLDAFEPEGVTHLAVDSIFMMPHLGVLASVDEDAALAIFLKDCLVPLATVLAPLGNWKDGTSVVAVEFGSQKLTVKAGELRVIELDGPAPALRATPLNRLCDLGNGPGKPIDVTPDPRAPRVIIDVRGRPLPHFDERSAQIKQVKDWYTAFGLET